MDLAEKLFSIESRVRAACQRSGRDPEEVGLLGVTKGHPPAMVEEACRLGLRLFGENKVQEAKAKQPQCPGGLRWHMIGHLQSNKCRDAVQLFEIIESVDSLSLAHEIDKWAAKLSKTMPVLLEVNAAGESTKFGFTPGQLLEVLPGINALPRLEVHGLMAMAPWTPDPEKTRPIFRQLRELKQRCEAILGAPLPVLSMGMSGDFEVAVEEGSTLIRIGTALFGPRGARPKQAAEDWNAIPEGSSHA